MNTVYLVENTTRIILPGTQWARDVLAKWAELGISAVATDQEPDLCMRESAEMLRMSAYLDLTGL